MQNPALEKLAGKKFKALRGKLDERAYRLALGAEAIAYGRSGISLVSRATGASRTTIRTGIKDLNTASEEEIGRVRKPGGGRKRIVDADPSIRNDLTELVEPTTRGDPESPLRWTTASTRKLFKALKNKGHAISHSRVADLLHEARYSLKANRKTKEGTSHPDRNAQFEFINHDVKKQLREHEPVISVDTKKKELVGDFKNNGREWRPKKTPEKVRVHDFQIKELGKVVPYGVYDIDRNRGWVNLGIDGDTAEFAVESIRKWWKAIGRKTYPHATSLTITADCGGSNSSRTRLWKTELQRFSNEVGIALRVRHFPPGTSKWNKIEHRLFSFITQNWRGKPLVSHVVIINLITATTTSTGLKVDCVLDTNKYERGIKVSDEEYAKIKLIPEKFHGEWNYTIIPAHKK